MEPAEPQQLLPDIQDDLFGAVTHPRHPPAGANLHDKFGQLRISKLRQHPRIRAGGGGGAQRFLHWGCVLQMCCCSAAVST